MKNFESTKVAKEEFESMIDYLEVENEKPVDIGEVSDGYHTFKMNCIGIACCITLPSLIY